MIEQRGLLCLNNAEAEVEGLHVNSKFKSIEIKFKHCRERTAPDTDISHCVSYEDTK